MGSPVVLSASCSHPCFFLSTLPALLTSAAGCFRLPVPHSLGSVHRAGRRKQITSGLSPSLGYPDHMVFSEFRRRFDVLAPHLTKKHGRNYIVVDERRVGWRPFISQAGEFMAAERAVSPPFQAVTVPPKSVLQRTKGLLNGKYLLHQPDPKAS